MFDVLERNHGECTEYTVQSTPCSSFQTMCVSERVDLLNVEFPNGSIRVSVQNINRGNPSRSALDVRDSGRSAVLKLLFGRERFSLELLGLISLFLRTERRQYSVCTKVIYPNDHPWSPVLWSRVAIVESCATHNIRSFDLPHFPISD